MINQQTIETTPFKKWIFENNENRILLVFSFIVTIISLCLLKYFYPYPNFMPPDSNNYIEAAINNDFINFWPIGYSKFLRLVSVFSRSHIALVILQYLLLIIGVLYFLFTIRFLLLPNKWIFRIILSISICNPLLSHIANFVSSDCIFATLSLLWFSQLLWIIHKPTKKLLLLHALTVLFSFMVRFTGIYYPLVSIIVISIVKMPTRNKCVGIISITLLILIFIGRTQHEYKTRTGKIQYSAFGGWQLAANALYGYAYARTIELESVPYKFRQLHRIVNEHMDSIKHLSLRPDSEPGVYYLWDFKSPLLKYANKYLHKNKKINYFEHWASYAPLYSQYGRWLIINHSKSFLKHYAWPNLIRYYNPPTFFMGSYNLGNKTVDPIVVVWFNWKSNQLPTRSKGTNISIIKYIPTLFSIINPAFLLCSLFIICLTKFNKYDINIKNVFYLTLLIWICNTIFSVLSAPIELRYQVFPLVITLPLLILFLSWIFQSLYSEQQIIDNTLKETLEHAI